MGKDVQAGVNIRTYTALLISPGSSNHWPLGGEDAIDDGVPPLFPLQDEDIMHYIENKVELRHGANQLRFQEGRPFLLQRALAPEVTLEWSIERIREWSDGRGR